MTLQDVREALEAIQKAADKKPLRDYEVAHALENELHRAVLTYIAEQRRRSPHASPVAVRSAVTNRTNLIELARLALRSADIEFDRHCA